MLIELSKHCKNNLKLIGIDNSSAMLDNAAKKASAFGVEIELINADLHDVTYDDAKLILSNYTLQFIRPLQREKLVKKIYDSLQDKGIFIFSVFIRVANCSYGR